MIHRSLHLVAILSEVVAAGSALLRVAVHLVAVHLLPRVPLPGLVASLLLRRQLLQLPGLPGAQACRTFPAQLAILPLRRRPGLPIARHTINDNTASIVDHVPLNVVDMPPAVPHCRGRPSEDVRSQPSCRVRPDYKDFWTRTLDRCTCCWSRATSHLAPGSGSTNERAQ